MPKKRERGLSVQVFNDFKLGNHYSLAAKAGKCGLALLPKAWAYRAGLKRGGKLPRTVRMVIYDE